MRRLETPLKFLFSPRMLVLALLLCVGAAAYATLGDGKKDSLQPPVNY